jgi:hypothetical protein
MSWLITIRFYIITTEFCNFEYNKPMLWQYLILQSLLIRLRTQRDVSSLAQLWQTQLFEMSWISNWSSKLTLTTNVLINWIILLLINTSSSDPVYRLKSSKTSIFLSKQFSSHSCLLPKLNTLPQMVNKWVATRTLRT